MTPATSEIRWIPVTNEIRAFLQCGQCLNEKPDNVSPREFAQLEVGLTPIGIQVWCKRHECNVMHISFEGHEHPAATSRLMEPPARAVLN